jgi:sugar phosphate permease
LFRLNFSIALLGIESDLKYTKTSLGFISAAFSLFYAVGQFVNGRLVNRVGARRLIFIGLTLSIAMNWLFGYIRDPLLSMVV